jgi:hypothetical protein
MLSSFYHGHSELISRRPCPHPPPSHNPAPTKLPPTRQQKQWQHTPKTISIRLSEIEFGTEYNKVIFFISFLFYILYACMFCAYSKQPSLHLRVLQFVHFRDGEKKKRGVGVGERTFTEVSNSKTFPYGIAFLIWGPFISSNF